MASTFQLQNLSDSEVPMLESLFKRKIRLGRLGVAWPRGDNGLPPVAEEAMVSMIVLCMNARRLACMQRILAHSLVTDKELICFEFL